MGVKSRVDEVNPGLKLVLGCCKGATAGGHPGFGMLRYDLRVTCGSGLSPQLDLRPNKLNDAGIVPASALRACLYLCQH